MQKLCPGMKQLVTGELHLFANEYFPSRPISYFQAALVVFAVLQAVFAEFAIFAVLHIVFADVLTVFAVSVVFRPFWFP